MPDARTDAFVFFGATDDLTYEQIFPALQALAGRGMLDMPIIGVAKDARTVDQLRMRARESVAAHSGLQSGAFAALAKQLSYVPGDYTSADIDRRHVSGHVCR